MGLDDRVQQYWEENPPTCTHTYIHAQYIHAYISGQKYILRLVSRLARANTREKKKIKAPDGNASTYTGNPYFCPPGPGQGGDSVSSILIVNECLFKI